MARLLRRLVVLAGAGAALLLKPAERLSAAEKGRGRDARSPAEIPARGWKDILLRTGKEFSEDEIPLIAAGVTFYTLLALFPALGAIVALYGLFADVLAAQRHLQLFAFLLPPDTVEFIGEQMVRIATASEGGLSLAFFSGLLASIWSANGAAKALITGLNIAYEEKEKRGFVHKTLISLAFTLGLIVFVLGGFAVIALSPTIDSLAGRSAGMVFRLISWPLLPLGMAAGLALLYRFGPSRDHVRWSWISWGSAAAVILWAAVSAGFSLYVGQFGNYDDTYGPLGAVIGFMMWIWLSSLVVLAGAELNSEIEHQTAVDTTVGAPKPLGLRRARMADTVGAAQGR
jgi:membrane protein